MHCEINKYLLCFRAVHSVCMWDEKDGPPKIYQHLQDDILDFIRQAQAVSKSLKKIYEIVMRM